MPLSGTRLGPYEILAPIGAGGMGEVYKALDTKLDREVAIKVLPSAAQDPERLARFEREAKVLASLNHPNIAQIYGIEESNGVRALVMELVPGQTLKQPLSLETSLDYAKQIADALEAAHEKTITHRDLKPANIMVTPAGVIKVLDFGLAAVSQPSVAGEGDPSQSPTLTMRATQAGMIMGTAGYMSPEQAAGQSVDRRADIWAFGVVLWEMLTGQRLFTGDTIAHILADVLRAPIDFDKLPKETPPPIRALAKRCLDRDVKTRLRDIGEARIAIQSVGKEPEVVANAATSRFGWAAWGAAGLPLVAFSVLAFVHFREKPPAAPEVVRFSMRLPEKGSLGGFPNVSVSPDGRRVAFIANTGGVDRLWVHSLDSLDSRPLAGTENVGGMPFWSPDSRSVVFGAQGKLKKIEASGGPPQTLCDFPSNLRGGFWTHDGRIVFATSTSGLLQVAAGGGPVSPVTTTDLGAHQAPALLPDGRHFVYVRTGAGERDGIYLGSLDAKPEAQGSKRLLTDVSQPAYAPGLAGGNGYVLFVREGTLMAQPLDGARLELTGDAVPVAENVPTNQAGQYSVSATDVLVYATGAGVGGRQLTWYDRQGKPGDTAWIPGMYTNLSLSSDATRVAVERAGNPSETWIFEFARGASTRLTPSGGTQPAWSPDGTHLVYRHAQQGVIALYLKASSGAGKDDVLLKASRPVEAKDWSKDGHFLLYEDQDPKTKWDLWALPMNGERKPAVFLNSEFNETDGKFSPDGRFVAYVSDESGKSEVYVSGFPDPKSGKWPISNGSGYQPRWRRDGKELLYFTGDGKLMSVDVTLSPAFKAGAPRVLFQAPVYGSGATVNQVRWDMTPDGKRFLINALAGDTSLPLTVVLNWQAGLKK